MNAPSSESEEFGAVVVAGGGDRASGLDTSLSFSRVHADQVQGNVFERGQVVCRVACAHIWSSLKAISKHRCRRFSTDQWARIAVPIRSASGFKLPIYKRRSSVVLPLISCWLSTTASDFSPGHCSGLCRQSS